MHGHETHAVACRHVTHTDHLVVVHVELVALLHLAVEQQLRALAELRGHPGTVPPDGHHRPRLVEYSRLHSLAPAVAHRLHRDAAHADRDRGLLAHAHRRDRPRVAPVVVGVGEEATVAV